MFVNVCHPSLRPGYNRQYLSTSIHFCLLPSTSTCLRQQASSAGLLPVPEPVTNSGNKQEVSSASDQQSSSINPVLNGLFESVGRQNSVSNAATENGDDKTGRVEALLNDTANLQRLLGVLDTTQQNSRTLETSHPSAPTSAASSASSTPPVSSALTNGYNPVNLGLVQPHMPGLPPSPLDMFGLAAPQGVVHPHGLVQPPIYPPHSTTMSILLNAANMNKENQVLLAPNQLAPNGLESTPYLLPPPTSTLYPGGPPTFVPGASIQASASLASSVGSTGSISTASGSLASARSLATAVSLGSLGPGSLGTGVSFSTAGSLGNVGSMTHAGTIGGFSPAVGGDVSRFLAPYPMSRGYAMAGFPRFPGAPDPVWGGYSTPTKRKDMGNVLPSPEPSPEGGYVGQHSQGLGGHYQSSYVARKRSRRN